MAHKNTLLKIIFIISACMLLYLLLTLPKTDCQACEFEYNGDIIDGYAAYDIFENACISYSAPYAQENIYVNLDDIVVGYDDKGRLNLTFNESYLK